MSNKKQISVIIPAYNAEKTILFSLNTVVSQLDDFDEVIVVDDGSTDSTKDLVARNFPRVILTSQNNFGSSVARQVGTELAKSEYILYLDADDWFLNQKILRYKEIISNYDISFMIADLKRADPEDDATKLSSRNSSFFPWINEYINNFGEHINNNLVFFKPEYAYKLLLKGYPVFPSTMLVKREAVLAANGWDKQFRRCQDFDIGLKMAHLFGMYYLHEVHVVLGLHSGNNDQYSYIYKQNHGDIAVLIFHYAHSSDIKYKKNVALAISKKYCNLAYHHRKNGKYLLSLKDYFNSLRWPGNKFHALIRIFVVLFLYLKYRK